MPHKITILPDGTVSDEGHDPTGGAPVQSVPVADYV